MSTVRNIDSKQAIAILNSRQTLNQSHIGQQVILPIQGSATFISAADAEKATPGQKQYFDKYIYNLKANSQELINRVDSKMLFHLALKAETAGNETEATALFNKWLNSVQVSFNQIADRGRKLENGDMVTAIVGEATTKSGAKAIVVNDVKYKAPAIVEKVTFSPTDLLGDFTPSAAEVEAAEAALSAKKVVA